MRHKRVGAAVGPVLLAVVALALAGCGSAPGVDGDLTNGWPAMPEARIPVPRVEVCYDVSLPTAPPGDSGEGPKLPAPANCAESHSVETVHVGVFAEDAPRPEVGAAERRGAYEDCAARARTFLGDDWRTGRVGLLLRVPDTLHWEAGARWYRCDLVEYSDLAQYRVVGRTSSLKGALSGARPLGLACFTSTSASSVYASMTPADCTTPHNIEFAGVFELPDGAYPIDTQASAEAQLAGCRNILADYAGVSRSDVQYRTGVLAPGYGRSAWELGNRGAQCFFWLADPVSRSVRGIGPGGLPIRYA